MDPPGELCLVFTIVVENKRTPVYRPKNTRRISQISKLCEDVRSKELTQLSTNYNVHTQPLMGGAKSQDSHHSFPLETKTTTMRMTKPRRGCVRLAIALVANVYIAWHTNMYNMPSTSMTQQEIVSLGT
jgi:hypothetical protein